MAETVTKEQISELEITAKDMEGLKTVGQSIDLVAAKAS